MQNEAQGPKSGENRHIMGCNGQNAVWTKGAALCFVVHVSLLSGVPISPFYQIEASEGAKNER